jgi:MraZ protein
MNVLTGQFDRTIDAKNRVQLPAQLRGAIEPERDGPGLYVTLGENRGTLAIFSERAFEALAARMETEFIPGPDSRRFELQFYGLASHVDIDKQGRFVLPDRLVKKAGLQTEVYLIGQKQRIEVWNRDDFDRSLGIDWEGDEWPDWQGFLRQRPTQAP